MTTAHVFIATSLDGFIAREDGDIGWLLALDDPTEDHGYMAFIADKDAIVMGRGTYETLRGHSPWPFELPVIVLSATLGAGDAPEGAEDRVRFLDAPPAEVLAQLKAEGLKRVYLDGGKVIQSFLRAGLVEDLVISVMPILLGQGRRLFGALPGEQALAHQGTISFPSGLVQSRYRISR